MSPRKPDERPASAGDLTRPLGIALAGLSGFVLLGAVLANPWVLGKLFVPDGHVRQAAPIVALQLAVAAFGVLLALAARHVLRRREPLTPRALRTPLVVVLVTFSLCLSASELVVRASMGPERWLTPNTDAWWEYRWRSEHSAEDTLLTRPKYGSDTFDRELGWIPRAGYESGDGRVRVNAQSIRATRIYPSSAPDGTRRVVIVGDSYTWGENVGNAETFAAQMESVATGLEVLNLGVHGYGTDQQLLRLRRDGLPFRPDVVVLAIFGQNIHRNVLRFRDYAKPRFVLEDGALVLEPRTVPSPEELLRTSQRLPVSRLLALGRRAFTNALARSTLGDVSRSERWYVTRALLHAAWRESEAAGARFLLVYIPWTVRREPLDLERPIAAWANDSGVPFLNLRRTFLELPAEEHERLYGGHWTPLGHRRAAEAIAARLTADDR